MNDSWTQILTSLCGAAAENWILVLVSLKKPFKCSYWHPRLWNVLWKWIITREESSDPSCKRGKWTQIDEELILPTPKWGPIDPESERPQVLTAWFSLVSTHRRADPGHHRAQPAESLSANFVAFYQATRSPQIKQQKACVLEDREATPANEEHAKITQRIEEQMCDLKKIWDERLQTPLITPKVEPLSFRQHQAGLFLRRNLNLRANEHQKHSVWF